MAKRVDLDEATEQAWAEFEEALTGRIIQLEPHEPLLLELDLPERESGCAPYVQLVTTECGDLQVEASSNRFLAEEYRLRKPARRELRAFGWQKPGEVSPNFWQRIDEIDGSGARTAAAMMVATLRCTFGAVHPSFLIGWSASEPDAEPVPVPTAVVPEDADHLRRLLEATFTADLGEPPNVDCDGDFPFVCGQSVAFVSVVDGPMPVVRIFGCLVVDVTEPERAAYEVAVLNRDFRWAKFVLAGDIIEFRAEILASTFVPDQLRFVLRQVCDFVARCAPDVAYRSSGRCFLEDAR